MKLILNLKNTRISNDLKGRIEKKAEKLERYFLEDTDVHITLTEENYQCKAEMMVMMKGYVLRAEEQSDDMYKFV